MKIEEAIILSMLNEMLPGVSNDKITVLASEITNYANQKIGLLLMKENNFEIKNQTI